MTTPINDAIPNLSNDEYHNGHPWKGYLSSTQLKWYRTSPKHYRFMLDNPQPPTEAMRFGSLFHDLMASLALCDGDMRGFCEWEKGFILPEPLVNPRTGKPYGVDTQKYQDYLTALRADNPGKELVARESYDLVCAMTHSLLFDCGATSLQVRKLLKWGTPEVSVFYETEDGIKLKVRPDLLTGNKIIDWKSVALDDLTEESINRVILKFGYHISAAMYQWVCYKVYGKWFTFILVLVQKQPPYDCVMVDMANYGYRYIPSLEMVQPGPGAMEFQKLLDLHTRCTKSGEWPGAETFIPGDKYRILEIEPPRYYSNRFLDE